MKQSNRLNRARYGLYAPVYDLAARPLERGRQRAIERLALSPDDRVLVVGCGTGSDLAYLPAGTSVSAIDLTPAMVDRTRDRAEALDLDLDARVGDAQSLPYQDGAFDAVLLHLVLSIVPDPRAVAVETERVLAPGGRVSIYDKFAPGGGTSRQSVGRSIRWPGSCSRIRPGDSGRSWRTRPSSRMNANSFSAASTR